MLVNRQKVFQNTDNKILIDYLNKSNYPPNLDYLFASVNELLRNISDLETHPEVIESLWIDYSKNLIKNCQAIILGRPALVNPKSGIIFGIAEGTNPPALRLPGDLISEAWHMGGKITLENLDGVYADAKMFGNNWIYFFSFQKDIEKYCQSAYEYASG